MSGEIKFMKIFSKVQGIIKKRQKLDSFYAHYKQYLKTVSSNTDLHNFITLKLVKQIKPIISILSFTKKLQPMYGGLVNYPQKCMWEKVTIMNEQLEKIWGLL